MPAAVVQTKASTHSAAATKTITLSPAGVAGNKLVVVASIFSNTIVFQPQTTPSSWTLDLAANPASSGQAMRWYSMDLVGGETTITFETSDGSSTQGVNIVAYEMSGVVAGSTAADKAVSSAFTSGVTSQATGTTGTLAQADEIAVASVMINNTSGGAEAWDSGFTIGPITTRTWTGHLVTAATTALNPTASWTTARGAHAGVVTYKASTSQTVTPSSVAATTSIPAPTVQAGTTVAPASVAATSAIDTMGAELSATATPASVAATTTIGAAAVFAGAPSVKVELFGSAASSFFDYFILGTSTLGGASVLAPAADVPIDITDYVRNLRVGRGRFRDIDENKSGSCFIELENEGRVFDPANTSSPFYGAIEPMRPIRVTAVVGNTSYPIFYGYAQLWTVQYRTFNEALAAVEAADAFSILANQKLPTIAAAHDGDLSGTRVGRVLDHAAVSFPADDRSIAAGLSTFGATTFGENALTYLQSCATSEGGELFVAADGKLTFKQRNTAPGASAATFSDADATGKIRYRWVDQDFGNDLLYNRIITSGTTGNEQTAEDATSKDSYRIRELRRTGQLVSSDAEMSSQANYLLARFATPEIRFRQVEVFIDTMSLTRQADLFGLEIGDRVTVERSPGVGTPATITQEAVVIGLDWDFPGKHGWRATVTFQAGERAIPFVLADATLGVLGDDFLGY